MNDIIQCLNDTTKKIPPCIPPLWAKAGHMQTIMGHLLSSPKLSERGEQLNITLDKDTERIHSTYLNGSSRTVVYLFHGLGGSTEASYMQRTAIVARKFGHHVFMNNHRGCGLGAGLATEPYHSGRADDLSKVIAYGRNMLPDHKHIAIGFSLSANALLLLAAGVRASVKPDIAIAINGPINLDRASLNLRIGLNKIYDKRFTKELKHYILDNRPQDLGDYSLVEDLRDFDERYTAPFGGFKNRDDYYETCSAKKYLPQINIPTLILTAEDDPFVDIRDYREASFSKSTVVHIEKHGGHMGYLTKSKFGYKRWLDQTLETYLRALS
jgi:predicted alpha/beta-fold hydrolase